MITCPLHRSKLTFSKKKAFLFQTPKLLNDIPSPGLKRPIPLAITPIVPSPTALFVPVLGEGTRGNLNVFF